MTEKVELGSKYRTRTIYYKEKDMKYHYQIDSLISPAHCTHKLNVCQDGSHRQLKLQND